MNLFAKIGLSACFLFTFLSFSQAQSKGYNIEVDIKDYEQDTLVLGYRLGSKTYVRDTTLRNDKGKYLFQGDEYLKGGVYIILLKPDNIYFEFLVGNDEEQKNLKISTRNRSDKNLVQDLKIQNSKENKVFVGYLHFLNDARKRAEVFEKDKKDLEGQEDKAAKLRIAQIDEELQKLNKEVTEYQNKIVQEHSGLLAAQLIKTARNPEVPNEIQAQGQEAAYRYFKAHYFDNFPWDDARLIRTPVFEEKLEFYLEKLTIPQPDSVVLGVEELLQLAKKGGDKDVYQYVASQLLNKYAGTKLICMDKVYVYIGKNYYCNGAAEWVEKEQLEKICENVTELQNVLCGSQAPPIKLRNIDNGEEVELYSVKAPFTVVYFWDPSCGNCTKTSKALVPVYEKYKDKGLAILGICSKNWKELDQCKKKIEESKMSWVNLSDESYPLAYVKKFYDIKVNPFIYLLDENKKIMWKRIDPDQLDDILEREFARIEEERTNPRP